MQYFTLIIFFFSIYLKKKNILVYFILKIIINVIVRNYFWGQYLSSDFTSYLAPPEDEQEKIVNESADALERGSIQEARKKFLAFYVSIGKRHNIGSYDLNNNKLK